MVLNYFYFFGIFVVFFVREYFSLFKRWKQERGESVSSKCMWGVSIKISWFQVNKSFSEEGDFGNRPDLPDRGKLQSVGSGFFNSLDFFKRVYPLFSGVCVFSKSVEGFRRGDFSSSQQV